MTEAPSGKDRLEGNHVIYLSDETAQAHAILKGLAKLDRVLTESKVHLSNA